ncbi:hypothetical protein QCA50_019068 [Cerrena zonata]|uniref:diacylglycerol O-acyltransferase n=1 Tax=Cerrena zonata TaxID=2478898 RepID=A0AAW0FKX0_9APHY
MPSKQSSSATGVGGEDKLEGLHHRYEVDSSSQSSQESKSVKNNGKKHRRSKSKKRRLNFAPLNTPLKNRLETIGIIWHTISIPFFICLFLGLISLGWIVWALVILPYFIWWYGFDLHTPTNGKVVYRVRDWMKNLLIWKWFVDYFPVRVHKTVELEPTFSNVLVEEDSIPDDEEDLISEHLRTMIDSIFKKLGLSKRLNDLDSYSPPPSGENDSVNGKRISKSGSHVYNYKKISTGPRYIFGYHPHGVISMGAMATFATNAIRNKPFEPPVKFLKPFFHDPSKHECLLPGIGDYLLSLGLTSASAKNIKSIINNGDNSVCIVVGGAQESLLNNMVSGYTKVGNGYKGDQYQKEDDDDDDFQEEPSNLSSDKDQDDDYDSDHKPKVKREIKLVLNKRKGFVKLAIELGNVSLVPTFAFGEADIYKLSIPKPGSYGYAFQQWMKNTFLNPIDVVMGRPIHIPEGALSEYRLKHPESEPSKPPIETNSDKPKANHESQVRRSVLTRLDAEFDTWVLAFITFFDLEDVDLDLTEAESLDLVLLFAAMGFSLLLEGVGCFSSLSKSWSDLGGDFDE